MVLDWMGKGRGAGRGQEQCKFSGLGDCGVLVTGTENMSGLAVLGAWGESSEFFKTC